MTAALQILVIGWIVSGAALSVAVVASWISQPIIAWASKPSTDRAFDRHVDAALEITRDDWHDWEREVAS